MTILEVIQRSTEFLGKKGVSSPRLQVELLLAHLLQMPRMKLYLNFERTLTDAETKALREMVVRRGNREPLQYIVGSACFCGLELTVNTNVLVPRPETELVAERAWNFLKESPGSALDLCTGSGCLAIALAVHVPGAAIHASDASAEALSVARANAATHGAKIEFYQGDLFAGIPEGARFMLIVSNPPYIPAGRIETLEAEVRDHEPRLALDGGADGMDFYRRIAEEGVKFLEPEGRLIVELDDDGGAATAEIFRQQKWVVEGIENDYSRHPRVLIARSGSS